jgi:hypothetical protein
MGIRIVSQKPFCVGGTTIQFSNILVSLARAPRISRQPEFWRTSNNALGVGVLSLQTPRSRVMKSDEVDILQEKAENVKCLYKAQITCASEDEAAVISKLSYDEVCNCAPDEDDQPLVGSFDFKKPLGIVFGDVGQVIHVTLGEFHVRKSSFLLSGWTRLEPCSCSYRRRFIQVAKPH